VGKAAKRRNRPEDGVASLAYAHVAARNPSAGSCELRLLSATPW